MKNIIMTLCLISAFNLVHAQNINWQTLNDNEKNIVYLDFGYDFGITSAIGFGHKLNTVRPIVLTADYSFPMGKNLLDDLKVRLGGQISILEKSNFIVSAKAYGVFRRHQTDFVRMASFGSIVSLQAGYYKPTWHIAAEYGFDKSITTHLKHSDVMRTNFPVIMDGWYIPSGGHFFYGIQGGKTIGENFELSLKVGATNSQLKDINPLLPYYAQLGLIWKVNSKKGSE